MIHKIGDEASVLLIDSPTDAVLIRELLQKNNSNSLKITTVSSVVEAKQALLTQTFCPDVILFGLDLASQEQGLAECHQFIDVPIVLLMQAGTSRNVGNYIDDYWYKGSDAESLKLILRCVLQRAQCEVEMRLAESVFNSAREGILITCPDGNMIEVNEALCIMTGYSRSELLGKNPRIFNSGYHDKDFYQEFWLSLQEEGRWHGEMRNVNKYGDLYIVEQTVSAVRDRCGRIQQYISLVSDMTPVKEYELQLEHIAHHDALTSLPNRVLLADRLYQAMNQTKRRAGILSVVYLDLDGFKLVNDLYGHNVGDQLLLEVASRMKAALREGDTLARLGGDEFVAVLPDLADTSASVPLLKRLLAAAAEPVLFEGLRVQVSASLGVTFYPQAIENDADQLLRQADQAMYQAKLSGKNRYHFFDIVHDDSVRGQYHHIEAIRLALKRNEFVLYYQPKVNMRTGNVRGVEALIRWQHPEQGLLSPAAFLPTVEEHPLGIELGEWVIYTALRQVAVWRSLGLSVPVSVNVSALQLQKSNFVLRVREILKSYPELPPEVLEIEVLETSALSDLVGVSRAIAGCRELGIRFALDDFGTGYSSLTYLKRLPVSQLKIDQSFVHDMLEDPDDLAILQGVLGLAHAFHHEVVAEGVESIEQGHMLLQLGCDVAQGYGISHPLPAEQIPDWVLNWRLHHRWGNVPTVSRLDFPLLFASVEHCAWVGALEKYLQGMQSFPPELKHTHCNVGKWLSGDGSSRYGKYQAFNEICLRHQLLHELAEQVCTAYSKDKNYQDLLSQLHQIKKELLAYVQQLLTANAE